MMDNQQMISWVQAYDENYVLKYYRGGEKHQHIMATGRILVSVAGELVFHEGAFGRYLIKNDLADTSLEFGIGGIGYMEDLEKSFGLGGGEPRDAFRSGEMPYGRNGLNRRKAMGGEMAFGIGEHGLSLC